MTDLPTCYIVTDNGPVLINASDYDPTAHTLCDAAGAPLGGDLTIDDPVEVVSGDVRVTDLKVDDAVEVVKAVDAAALDAVEADELAGKGRKMVLEAIAKRRAELTAAE